MDTKNHIAVAILWITLLQPAWAAPEQSNVVQSASGKPNVVQSAPGKPRVLEEIYKFGDHTLCPIICNPPLLFPPILCKITEIKTRCLEKCPGVTYLGGKKTIDLKECKAAIDKPFAKVSEEVIDKFCYYACNRVSCSDLTIPIPTKEGIVKLPWPGKAFGNTICRVFCKEAKVKKCLEKAGEFSLEDLIQEKPVELP